MLNQNYDEVKYQTLLFFIEHLMQKSNNVRSIHDLSCQFGTKGFTKEMKKIVGNSEAGLRKFLSQYPSIFTIYGDFVKITNYSDESDHWMFPNSAVTKRDYISEAAIYFQEKLISYGPGSEVPTECLLGHRSQAPPEIRHVSGQHIKDFKEFLLKFPDIFLLTDDKVSLKKFEKTDIEPKQDVITMNPELLKKLMLFLYQKVQEIGTISIQHLFYILQNNLDKSIACFLQSPQDLSIFLKMHGDRFIVKCHMVSTVCTENVTNLAAVEKFGAFKKKLSSVILETVASNNKQYDINMDYKLQNNIKFITNVRECENVVNVILRIEPKIIALDLLNYGTEIKGLASLLLLSTWEGTIYAFDLLIKNQLMLNGKLNLLLESEYILKVMHDCRIASAVLYNQFKISIKNVLDLQAMHTVISQQNTDRPAYSTKHISLPALCTMYGITPPQKSEFQQILQKDPNLCAHRPLNNYVLKSIIERLTVIIPTLYVTMNNKLDKKFISLANELSQDQLIEYIDRTLIQQRKHRRKLIAETAKLSDKIKSASSDQSLILSNKECKLLQHITVNPSDITKLNTECKAAIKLKRFLSTK